MTNCYKILGVKDFASAEEIKIAYRKLSKKLHPDVNDGDKFFEERFKELQNAYEILCDSRIKEIHDSKLRNTFSDSNNFDFKEKDKSENNEHTTADKANSQNNKSAYERKETKSTSAQSSSIPKVSKGNVNNYISVGIGAFLFIILIIIIVAISSRTRKGLDDYSSSNNNSQNYTPNYNPNQSIQAPSYQDQDLNSNETESEAEDVEANQTYEVNSNYFTVGSTKNEVLKVQGAPTRVNKYETIGEEVWNYEFSTITFKNGRVSEYSNISRNLNAKMVSSNQNGADYFTIGSSKDDVLATQGNPTGINKYETLSEEVWKYEFSTVTFKHGQVSEFSNISKNLNAKMTNSIPNGVNYFSVGSTKNEVLQAQGNPSGINKYEVFDEEVWRYDFSTVTFKNGYVSEFSNISKNLNVRY